MLPDKDGKIEDCVLGFDTQAEYDRIRDHTNFFGATVGRVANRIAGSVFYTDSHKIEVEVNEGEKNHLHGGNKSWHRKNWESKEVYNGVEFSYNSPDGDCKYPGNVLVSVRYILEKEKLKISFEARLAEGETKSTPINLTNHTYFNLAGHNSTDSVLSHLLRVHADHYTPTDSACIPTRVCKSLKDEPSMDFRHETKLEDSLRMIAEAKGYSEEEIEQAV